MYYFILTYSKRSKLGGFKGSCCYNTDEILYKFFFRPIPSILLSLIYWCWAYLILTVPISFEFIINVWWIVGSKWKFGIGVYYSFSSIAFMAVPISILKFFNLWLSYMHFGMLKQELHYNQHELLLLEGQGIYCLGDSW